MEDSRLEDEANVRQNLRIAESLTIHTTYELYLEVCEAFEIVEVLIEEEYNKLYKTIKIN